MKTLKIILIVALALSMGVFAYAQIDYSSGNYLISQWAGEKKLLSGGSMGNEDLVKESYFSGYVTAILEAMVENNSIYIAESVPLSQVYRVVGKYLEDHPEELHKRSYYLVSTAIKKAFPKY